MSDDIKITVQDAYIAMYRFLEHEYNMTKSDEIGGMLGSMSLLDDGKTADPAIWNDWLRIVEEVLSGNNDIILDIIN